MPITITEVTSSSQSSRFSDKLNVKRRVITQKGASSLSENLLDWFELLMIVT